MSVRLRFAPSPTGSLHLGGLRTALVNFLTAKKLGGTFTLRIEDTDQTRLVPGSVDDIRRGLEWAGIHYDHGPGIGGTHGPYVQSERLDLYHHYTKKLLDTNHAYRCFCSPDKLAATKEKLQRTGSNLTYDRTCSHLTEEEVARRVRDGDKHIVRLNNSNIPRSTTPVSDIVFGALKDTRGSLPTDPVLLKTDKFPTYHLANVVDDHLMGITHVVRGEEWLQSLPLHMDLYAALNVPPPQFAHLPLLLNSDGSKMSKRKGDVRVVDYIDKGWEPEAVTNWLALAGWSIHRDPQSDTTAPLYAETLDMTTLTSKFDLASMTHRRVVLSPEKLSNLNKQWIMRKAHNHNYPTGLDNLVERSEPRLRSLYSDSNHLDRPYLRTVITSLADRLSILPDIEKPELSSHFFTEPDYSTPMAINLEKTVKKDVYKRVLESALPGIHQLQSCEEPTANDVRTLLDGLKTTFPDLKSKDIMNPLRHALTGSKVGPSVVELIAILGPARSIGRIESALERVEAEIAATSDTGFVSDILVFVSAFALLD